MEISQSILRSISNRLSEYIRGYYSTQSFSENTDSIKENLTFLILPALSVGAGEHKLVEKVRLSYTGIY